MILAASIEYKIDQVVSAFENGTTEIQYCYIENIHDGRGYTAGKAGFTTANGDFLEFVEKYQHGLAKYLPELKRLADAESEEVKGLKGIVRDYKSECRSTEFMKAQDDLVDEMYKSPARGYVKELHLKSPLAYLIVYDSLIQHGDGDDPDSFQGILKRMKKEKEEVRFLHSFLDAREGILLHANDPATRDEWRRSVDRVRALRKVLDQGNLNLEDLKIRVWDEDFTIKGE